MRAICDSAKLRQHNKSTEKTESQGLSRGNMIKTASQREEERAQLSAHLPHAPHTSTAKDVPEEYFLGQLIPLHYHYNMLMDKCRVDMFREAISHSVRPGSRVLELGGGTGILSFFAAQKAEKVWCVERNPALVQAAEQFLAKNRHGERVEVIEADAMTYLPDEPVDVVICEMLHVALLREKQIQVIDSFKERYFEKFGGQMPIFVPTASLLAVQPVEQSFDFAGYHAEIPIFQVPTPNQSETLELADPVIYNTVCYEQALPHHFQWEGTLSIRRPGLLNAVRFATKNLLAILIEEQRAVEWLNQFLVLPIDEPFQVEPGDQVTLSFSCRAGSTIEGLTETLSVRHAAMATGAEESLQPKAA